MVKILLMIVIVAILMEDGSSIKKSPEEEREDEEVAKAVNATLAEEERKKKEEEDEKKKKKDDKIKGKKEDIEEKRNVGDKDEACPPVSGNASCPEVQECGPCGPCPEEKTCPDPAECPKGKDCPQCPSCKPCVPCPVDNTTRVNLECPSLPSCTESSGMSVPVAMVVGASISLVTMGAAAAVGLILRYVPPLISGIFFLSIVFVVWFLSSHYPDAARELGARAATLLREAATSLSHRVMEALRHHNEQVGFS
jgi:hypothetical protein